MEQFAIPQQGDVHQARIGRIEDGPVLTPASSANYGQELVKFHGSSDYHPVYAGPSKRGCNCAKIYFWGPWLLQLNAN